MLPNCILVCNLACLSIKDEARAAARVYGPSTQQDHIQVDKNVVAIVCLGLSARYIVQSITILLRRGSRQQSPPGRAMAASRPNTMLKSTHPFEASSSTPMCNHHPPCTPSHLNICIASQNIPVNRSSYARNSKYNNSIACNESPTSIAAVVGWTLGVKVWAVRHKLICRQRTY